MFKYDDQVEMPRAFEKFFYGTSRREGQTLLNYVAEHREALAELEKHGISLPDKVAGWVLLRRAGLSQEQKQLIQGRAPDYAQKAVTEAMYFLLGQDYKGKNADRSWRGKGYGSPNRWRGRQQGYITEDFYEAEDDNMVYDENFDDTEFDEPWDNAYYEYEEQTYAANDEVDVSDETYWEAEQNYEDAFATYFDARRQMAHLKASRGFFPVVALTDGGGSAAGSPMSQGPRPPKAVENPSPRPSPRTRPIPGSTRKDRFHSELTPHVVSNVAKLDTGQLIAHRLHLRSLRHGRALPPLLPQHLRRRRPRATMDLR